MKVFEMKFIEIKSSGAIELMRFKTQYLFLLCKDHCKQLLDMFRFNSDLKILHPSIKMSCNANLNLSICIYVLLTLK